MNVVIVSWQGGGASQPAIGLGRLLASRGHGVRIIGPESFAERVAAAGCRLCPVPRELEFDATEKPMFEDQEEYATELFFGRLLPGFVAAEVQREPADVIVVDHLLRSVACLAETLTAASVLMMHMAYAFTAREVDDSTEPWSPRWQYGLVNAVRSDLGLTPLAIGPDPLPVALAKRANATLVAMTREFDPWPATPENVVHVGPIVEEPPGASWEPPWDPADSRPLIVISMSTQYMRHEQALRDAAGAASAAGGRVLVLSGLELSPEALSLPPEVIVRSYVPHAAVFPHASLVVTHGGMGTVMAAFAAGLPAICLPLGRDQHVNANRARELGAATVLASGADQDAIEQEIRTVLASDALRTSARRMAASVKDYGDGTRAVDVIERLIAPIPGSRGSRSTPSRSAGRFP
jgi:MGT family glycosyltransferase